MNKYNPSQMVKLSNGGEIERERIMVGYLPNPKDDSLFLSHDGVMYRKDKRGTLTRVTKKAKK